jgi:hypothetical protein
MSIRDICVTRINALPDALLLRVLGYIDGIAPPEAFPDDTEFLKSIPGMWESIIEGVDTPLSECVPLAEVWRDAL